MIPIVLGLQTVINLLAKTQFSCLNNIKRFKRRRNGFKRGAENPVWCPNQQVPVSNVKSGIRMLEMPFHAVTQDLRDTWIVILFRAPNLATGPTPLLRIPLSKAKPT